MLEVVSVDPKHSLFIFCKRSTTYVRKQSDHWAACGTKTHTHKFRETIWNCQRYCTCARLDFFRKIHRLTGALLWTCVQFVSGNSVIEDDWVDLTGNESVELQEVNTLFNNTTRLFEEKQLRLLLWYLNTWDISNVGNYHLNSCWRVISPSVVPVATCFCFRCSEL